MDHLPLGLAARLFKQSSIQAIIEVIVTVRVPLKEEVHAHLFLVLRRVLATVVFFTAAFLKALHLLKQPLFRYKTEHHHSPF